MKLKFQYSEEEKRFYAKHHPFTAPVDAQMLKDNPKDAMAKAYDIVLNGYEIGGGSIRIHNQDIQSLMFNTLGLSKEEVAHRFGFFVDALKYGTPPHGGIAFGFDRLCALLGGSESIRDFIAFPKNNSGRDVMLDAPSSIDDKQFEELQIKLNLK